MSTAAHTPGPWFIHDEYGPNDGGSLVGPLGQSPVGGLTGYYGRDGQTANARLIAAAPELLDVVNAFVAQEVEYMTINNLGDPEKQHNVKWARAVIAKATGAA